MDFDYAINVIKETPELNDEMKKQVITLKDGHLVNFRQKGTYYNENV